MIFPLNTHHRFLLCALLLALFACSAVAEDTGAELSARFPAGSIATVEAAESARQQAASENARIERQYAQDGLACDTAFFVNSCRDKVKERRRAAAEPVRRVQIEADTAMRRIQAAGKDQALAARRLQRAAETIRNEQHAQQNAQVRAIKNSQRMDSEQAQALHARAAGQQVRQPRQQAQTAAEVQKRAANVVAYDRKIRKAQAHQRAIAARKAEKYRGRKIQPAAAPDPAVATPASKP